MDKMHPLPSTQIFIMKLSNLSSYFKNKFVFLRNNNFSLKSIRYNPTKNTLQIVTKASHVIIHSWVAVQ